MHGSVKSPVSRKPDLVRTRILDAAQAEFMEHGFASASTNRILARFGGSKPTMFRHFPTKRAMFEAVVTRIASRWSDQMDWQAIDTDEPEGWLTSFGYRALKWILSEENLFLGRMAVTEDTEPAATARLYRSQASEPMETLLAQSFGRWNLQGRLASPDPERDAIAFLDLALSGMVSRTLYGFPVLDDDKLLEHVRYCVALFLKGRGLIK